MLANKRMEDRGRPTKYIVLYIPRDVTWVAAELEFGTRTPYYGFELCYPLEYRNDHRSSIIGQP